MNNINLKLKPSVLGEYLAALGLLRIASLNNPNCSLRWGDDFQNPQLQFDGDENTLLLKVLESIHPKNISIGIFKEGDLLNPDIHAIGDNLYHLEWFILDELNAKSDPSGGAVIRFQNLEGLEIWHFQPNDVFGAFNQATPLKFWAGAMKFGSILKNITSSLKQTDKYQGLDDLLSVRINSSSRLRLDSRFDQFPIESGGVAPQSDVLNHEPHFRPAIEILALIGLSFYPPVAGFESFQRERYILEFPLWRNFLDAQTTLISLHSGVPSAKVQFRIQEDGKLKKIHLGQIIIQ